MILPAMKLFIFEFMISVSIMANSGLTQKEIAANGIVLFLAGFYTTAATLAFMLYSLAHQPQVQSKLYTEITDTLGEVG